MKTSGFHLGLCALLLAAVMPLGAQAHRAWLLPSSTVLSGDEPWLTVDAAISNDLFYFEHQPMRLDGVSVLAPDGSSVKLENAGTGRYRSTFDVRLEQKGTYKVVRLNEGLFASYQVDGETQRYRGSADGFASAVPAGATDLRVTLTRGRIETFVTAGAPTTEVFQPTGVGLELVPVTHPNDLFAGETAEFRFLLDGKPAAALEVVVIPGGIRYRDQLQEAKYVTDSDGLIRIEWPAPGLYWLNATAESSPTAVTPGTEGAAERRERASYAATLEVLPL